jgi:FMN phosphatase YigB (HAD superfamily)
MIEIDPNSINAVAFDIGGVLAADFWETLYFNDITGIVEKLDLDREYLAKIGAVLSQKYCLARFQEAEYWREFSQLVGRTPTKSQLELAETSIWADITFRDSIDKLRRENIRVYIVSDNTAFWFEKQVSKLSISGCIPASDIFLSYDLGKRKKSTPCGTYAILAQVAEPKTTLILDDRRSNLKIAGREGFKAVKYKGSARARIIDEITFVQY